MSQIKGTNVIAPVVPLDTTDVHPSHEARYGKGGYRSAATTAERDAIPTPRREAGMLVYVAADGLIYQLAGDLTTWSELATGGAATVTWGDITGKPTFATVATSGSASDLGSGTLSASRLPTSGVGAGTYTSVTVDTYGRVTAGGSHSVAWNDISSKPSSFTPASHSHGSITNDGYLGTTAGQIVVTGFGGLVGTASSITPGQVVTETTYTNFLPEGGSLATALSGIDSAISGRAAASHQHAPSDVFDADGFPIGSNLSWGGGESLVDVLGGIDIILGNKAALSHAHGAITSDGKVGTTAGLVLKTGTAGAVEALAQGTAGQVLKVNSTATGVEWGAAAADVSIDTTAADILSASSGSITADDAGADKIVFWDDSAGKLTYLSAGTNITITDTTISAAGSTSASDLTSGTLADARLSAKAQAAIDLYLWSAFR